MSTPFLGEIRMLPYSYAPVGWARCLGQLIPISQNSALFSIIGDIYGGDGRTTMGLPNLIGRAPIGAGLGPGLSNQILGERSGYAEVSLSIADIPSHTHATHAYNVPATTGEPNNTLSPAKDNVSDRFYTDVIDIQNMSQMSAQSLKSAGNSLPHENRQPYLVTPFCICLDGVYPSRN